MNDLNLESERFLSRPDNSGALGIKVLKNSVCLEAVLSINNEETRLWKEQHDVIKYELCANGKTHRVLRNVLKNFGPLVKTRISTQVKLQKLSPLSSACIQ